MGRADQLTSASLSNLEARLEAQAAEIRALRAAVSARDGDVGKASSRRVEFVTESQSPSQNKFYADYDGGFRIRPFDPERSSFELKINGWIQFRHHGFARDAESWADNSGVTRLVRNRNAWDVERARLTFGGRGLDERLTYFLQLDGDTDGRHTVDFFDYWWAWKFSDAFSLQIGKRKVTASRQWLLGACRTRFADRPMANDFFRPDRTVGVFAKGRLRETFNYEVMVGKGYRTSNAPNARTDSRFTFAIDNYWDPFGDFGGQLVDYDFASDTPLVRFGHSFVYSPVDDDQIGAPLGEADFVRLSGGTRLSQIGALAPGVTVRCFLLWSRCGRQMGRLERQRGSLPSLDRADRRRRSSASH